MAIADGLICQVYPVAGETSIKNIVDGTLFTGTGTPTLVDEGAEKAWSISTGTLLESSIPLITVNGENSNAGATIAMRFKSTALGTDSFMPIAGARLAAAALANGLLFGRGGSQIYRGRIDVTLTASMTSRADNTIHTLVYKVSTSTTSNTDVGSAWVNTAGRVGTAANFVSSSANILTKTFDKAFINCQTNSAYRLLDLAIWGVEKSDADCAAIADDYRAVMPAPGGGTAPTGTVTLGTPTGITSSSAAIPYSYSASDQTGFEYRLNGGAATTVTTSPLVVTGLAASTPYTVEMRAINASGAGVWSDPANFTTSAVTAAISFSGTIPAQVFTAGQTVSVNLAPYFTGTLTPFTFANTGALLTGTGLSITSAGLLAGTATTGSAAGVIVTGTDASLNTAASNAFNVAVNAASVPVSFGGTIPAITGAQNAAITPVNTSTYFSGSLTPFTYSLFSGTLPSGVTLNSSTGFISGTPTVNFSGNIVVRATDSGSNTANSNSIAVTIAAAVGTITITDVVNNTNTPWTSAAVDAATVMPLSLGSVVVNKTGLSVTVGAELVITDASIVTGTEYIIILKIGTAYGWYRAVAT